MLLAEFSLDENGDLLFGGERIKDVKKYQNPSSLPEDAPLGTLAIALQDDEITEPEQIELDKTYKYLKVRDNIDVSDFKDIIYIDPDQSASDCEIMFSIVRGTEDTIAELIFLYNAQADIKFVCLVLKILIRIIITVRVADNDDILVIVKIVFPE